YVIEGTPYEVPPKDIIIYGTNMYLNIASDLYKTISKNLSSLPIISVVNKLIVPTISHPGQILGNEEFIEYPIININAVHKIKSISQIEVPQEFHKLVDFFLDKIKDFNTYEEYSLNLDWFLSLKSIYEKDVENSLCDIKCLRFAYGNNNYNYKLGFEIKLTKLNMIFRKNPEFDCERINTVSKYVRLSLPMVIPPELKDQVGSKSKTPSHKFIIYKTGSVTQSGPHPFLNNIAYNKFITEINNNIETLRSS
ncbi:MAG TPA: hypothetical protein VKR58_02330, partial [Aquella sp.]|nr:hypothetical protein [Aquella sp.]